MQHTAYQVKIDTADGEPVETLTDPSRHAIKQLTLQAIAKLPTGYYRINLYRHSHAEHNGKVHSHLTECIRRARLEPNEPNARHRRTQ